MIYRLSTPHSEFGRCSPGTIEEDYAPPRQDQLGPLGDEFGYCFEEVPCEPSSPLCRVFRTPVLSDFRMRESLRLTPVCAKDPLDIIVLRKTTFVSERARQVIESVDDFGHQFRPVQIYARGKPVDPGQPYYRMNMRRFVSIHPLGRELGDDRYREDLLAQEFSVDNTEEAYLPTILHTPALRAVLETLPMWCHWTADRQEYRHPLQPHFTPLYMNGPMLRSLQQAGVRGVAEFSTRHGKSREYVAHV